ncbi:5617_t:CDS:2 [Funneliformis geosporum]|uniref:9518_t:CDS:1 n=1 Tax=Funneliformis geosporum TaxID=1117311 RepID=A0A9W4SDG3_9GLOM|nr:5617_t:CDS:2 [Funneliformis geosporum]CAI2165634.1 9518_t:CDS:2 [Funneliformis geosporum]
MTQEFNVGAAIEYTLADHTNNIGSLLITIYGKLIFLVVTRIHL